MHTGWQDSLMDTCVKQPLKCKKWVAAWGLRAQGSACAQPRPPGKPAHAEAHAHRQHSLLLPVHMPAAPRTHPGMGMLQQRLPSMGTLQHFISHASHAGQQLHATCLTPCPPPPSTCRYQHSYFLGPDDFHQLLQQATYVPVLRRFEGFEMMGVEALFTGTRPIVYDAMIETKPYR